MIDATQTFHNHEILLTGANGFVGKVMLGLLLDRFPECKHLHILVRPRPGTSAGDRFRRDVLTSPALQAIVERADPSMLRDRITIHPGDIGDSLCGLGEETLEKLSGRVSLVINCAGLVEFFAPVDEAFKSNVDGVENVIGVCRRLKTKLVHVSTCFVCGEADGLVEETEPILGFYPRRKDREDGSFRHRDEIALMRTRIRDVYDSANRGARILPPKEITQKLVDLGAQRAALWGWVNIYTYSKSLGEQLIVDAGRPAAQQMNGRDPIEYSIVRPAIVEAALEFPFPGWVEGGRTAAPLVMMALSGQRYWPLRKDAPLEVVPVDQVASSILTAAALLLNGKAERVYQIGAADRNPVPLGSLVEWMHEDYLKQKRRPKFLSPGVRILTPQRARLLNGILHRRIVGLQRFVVGTRRLAQRAGLPGRRGLGVLATKLRMLGLQATVRDQMLELYQPFMYDNRFIFEAENIRAGHARLRPQDQVKLPWSPERIEWKRYWSEHEVKGIQKWVQAEFTKGRTFKL
ncbi:MAG: SDR family oxidoreductase [Acidobacteriia bacterium]|nr:SDR family oxidoreductase [Terriglobia bacterium]